tara:strand:+ start:3058 stop:3774 length:717 start_codon:yes stop_codon:yes gene_type:complete
MPTSDEDNKIERDLLIFNAQVTALVKELEKLKQHNITEETKKRERQYDTNKKLVQLVAFVEGTNKKEEDTRNYVVNNLARQTKKEALNLRGLIKKHADELYAYKGIKNRLDNEQNAKIAKVKAEIAKGKAELIHQVTEAEGEISVNKVNIEKETVIRENQLKEESSEREAENQNLKAKLAELELRATNLNEANEIVKAKMQQQVNKMGDTITYLEKIVEELQTKIILIQDKQSNTNLS